MLALTHGMPSSLGCLDMVSEIYVYDLSVLQHHSWLMHYYNTYIYSQVSLYWLENHQSAYARHLCFREAKHAG